MTYLVSIIIPCYNAEPWLAEALESALAQTWPHKEIIVINDGSSDGSLAVANKYTARQVRVIDQPNQGASAARNRGLHEARGDFIQFLDADDLLAPDKIALQMAVLAAAPDGSVAAGPWGRFERDTSDAVFVTEENWRDSTPIDWLILNFAGRGMMQPAAWLTPRRLVTTVGPWDERLTVNDDGEYFCRILLASTGIRFCADARSYYRSNLAGSLSQRRTTAAWCTVYLDHELCVRHLLTAEDSPRTRRACADLFQRLAYAVYPDEPELAAKCEEQACAHGGSSLQPGGGPCFKLLCRHFGWKLARRLQQIRSNRQARRDATQSAL